MDNEQSADDYTVLSTEQLARVEALAIAREALADQHRALGGAAQGSTIPKRFTVVDLIDVAEWVINGTDPMASYRAAHDESVVFAGQEV